MPAEFVGLARALRREVLQHDETASAILHKVMVPVHLRLREHARMRPEALIDIARRWRLELPARFRLSFDVVRDRHHGAAITERRVCASLMKCDDWDDPDYKEVACSILEIRLVADKKRTKLEHQVIAAISLHAMARWFQRSRDASEAMLIEDVRTLASHVVSLRELERRDFTAPTPRGVWTGHLVEVENHRAHRHDRVCAARTFIDSDSIVDAA